jgi:hypothetical protein
MKRLLLTLAGLGALALAGHASAATDTDSKTVGIVGTVANLCVLGSPSSTSVDLGQMVDTSGAHVGRITTIGNQTVTLPGSFCNFAGTTLTVQATALTAADATPPSSGFSRAVNYTSTVSNWAATNAVATTTASLGGAGAGVTVTGSGSNQAAPKLSDLSLVLSGFTVPSDLLLVSGGYSGSVTVTLGPSSAP